MAEDFGGPVWHASGRGKDKHASKQVALYGLLGVGDAKLGEWTQDGEHPGIVHVQRRLTAAERAQYNVPEPYDIRGTPEEQRRIAMVLQEAPYVARYLG